MDERLLIEWMDGQFYKAGKPLSFPSWILICNENRWTLECISLLACMTLSEWLSLDDEWMHAWMHEWTHEWMHEWTHEWTHE